MAKVIPPDLKKTIGFIFIETSQGPMPIGTGFFVKVQDRETSYVYFVTAKHVIQGQKEVLVRLNTRDWDPASPEPGMVFTKLQVKDAQGNLVWATHPDPAIDLAVFPGSPGEGAEFKTVGLEMFVNKEFIDQERVTEGDEVFFVGLLPQYYGTKRNHPVVRYGRLALVTDEKIYSPDGPVELFFAECQSFPGNSGSPVFLQLGPTRQPGTITLAPERLMLLGVMLGFVSQQVDISQGASFQENVGIAAIAPIERLKEILLSKPLVQQRMGVKGEKYL
ncbi:MAG: trypsin-like peptidase domain-containing protein [Euryarchaeota archaeon]|nr:trypsin-like peptidase domain-containing protein [Euryarchaeota archaeon]